MHITYIINDWKKIDIDLSTEEFREKFHELTMKMGALDSASFLKRKNEEELKVESKHIEEAINVYLLRRAFGVNADTQSSEEEQLGQVCYDHWFAISYLPYETMRRAYELATKYYIKISVTTGGLDRRALML